MANMPKHPIESLCAGLDDYERKMVLAGWTNRGEDEGVVRMKTAKPFKRPKNEFEGCANYTWRMLAFGLCGSHPYVCIPVMCDFDLALGVEREKGDFRYGEPGYEEQRAYVKGLRGKLDSLVDRVERNLPLGARLGILRWGRALGTL